MLSFGPQGIDLSMEPLNALIGPNGSGKSNFIELLDPEPPPLAVIEEPELRMHPDVVLGIGRMLVRRCITLWNTLREIARSSIERARFLCNFWVRLTLTS